MAKARILLVEDNPMNHRTAAELLRSEGFVVDVAEDGEEAVRCVRERNYDAVLLDIQMSLTDGEAACRLIRRDSGFDGLPVLAMTVNATES